MIQIISMRSPTRTVEGMTEFIQAVQDSTAANEAKLLAMSITSPDMFGYITYLVKVDKNEDEIGKQMAHQLEPCRWTMINEPLEGFVWKSCGDPDVPLTL